MSKYTIVPLEELGNDEPRYGRWINILGHGAPAFIDSDAVCKVLSRYGNSTEGWRYLVEYKCVERNERFSPPDFHIEAATEEEWNNQPPIDYPPHKWQRRDKEYEALPRSYIMLTSGDWYEVFNESGDEASCKEAFPDKTDVVGLQNFCKKQGLEFVSERHIINHLNSLGWKVKRVGGKYH